MLILEIRATARCAATSGLRSDLPASAARCAEKLRFSDRLFLILCGSAASQAAEPLCLLSASSEKQSFSAYRRAKPEERQFFSTEKFLNSFHRQRITFDSFSRNNQLS